ncbi:MAG: hypothetical protein H0X26_04000 [Alphaproteobacteria bacterium]|nr:hypothetical protein [Alphaproteobacteria bacterium]
MKNAFKKNPALFMGLILPLLMILLFSGVPFFASFMVASPEYNFIYSVNNYNPEGKLRVDNGKLVVQVSNFWSQPKEAPEIYLVDVHSNKTTKLNFSLLSGEDSRIPVNKTRDLIIEGVTLKGLDTSNIAPDGYQIRTGANDNFFSLLFFFGGDRRNSISLSKSGRSVKIPTATQGYNSIRFEGWIIPSPDEKL